MSDDAIAARVAADYPYLSSDAQAHAVEIVNSTSALMGLATNADAFPSADVRKMLGQQIANLRSTAINMIGQK